MAEAGRLYLSQCGTASPHGAIAMVAELEDGREFYVLGRLWLVVVFVISRYRIRCVWIGIGRSLRGDSAQAG